MGRWGRKLFENDVVLDVKDTIDAVVSRAPTDQAAKEEIIKCLDDATYDEDDTPIAWLAAASILLKRYPVEREYESLLSGAAIVNIEAIRSAIQKSAYVRIYKKRHYITNWRRGTYMHTM